MDVATFECVTTRSAGQLSESDGMRLSGPLASGRTGQRAEKNDALVRFAQRVCDGEARPDEITFMLALMAQDIPTQG